jgi:hypothetical protein
VGGMNWRERLRGVLEPVLEMRDPRTKLSAYHDMPYAIFCYPPDHELELRKELELLATRLVQKGKVVTTISLAECLDAALRQEAPWDKLAEAERTNGVSAAVDTVHAVLTEYCPLVDLVAARMPEPAEPTRDVVFIVRAGALFPVYRTSSLLEQLKGKVPAPAVLFYPGVLDGPAGLRFMGVLDPEHNYRSKIF